MMDKARRKELLEQYQNRRPEMGVLCFKCKATGESFLAATKDSRGDFNSVRAKLSMNAHPNKHLVALWQQHGKDGFETSMRAVLEYEDPLGDYSDKLEAMVKQCLLADENAKRIWR